MAQHTRNADTYRYLSLVNAIPALPREEELDLARRYLEHGDEQAKHRVIRANLRQVIPHALRYSHFGISTAELISQGNLALVAALDRFEPERGLRFATYASHWVRAEILALILRQRSMVGGGRGPLRAKYVFQLRRKYRALLTRLGDHDAAAAQLASEYKKTPEQIRDIVARIDSRDASLDVPAADSEAASLMERLPDDAPSTDHQLAAEQERALVGRAVRHATSDLNERERFIVSHRLMADEDSRLSLMQIGAHFGVSRERARQLESSLKNKLRRRLSQIAPLLAGPVAA